MEKKFELIKSDDIKESLDINIQGDIYKFLMNLLHNS